jgi:hypothetical protein
MRKLIGIVLLLICFILPLHFFIMGNNVGFGLQGVFYQYKVSGYGLYFGTMTDDLRYVLHGTYTGRTMISIIFWVLGSLCIMAATFIWLINNSAIRRFDLISGVLIIMASVIYLLSVIFQYGVFFYGPAGTSIPFGIPLLVVVGYLMMKSRDLDQSYKNDEI